MLALGGLTLTGGGGAAAPAPPAELLVNTGFTSGDNWALTGAAVISGGTLTCTPDEIPKRGTQTLVGGSVPAADYVVGLDYVIVGSHAQVFLRGAADENRGSHTFDTPGAGQTATIAADGEVSKFQIVFAADPVIDAVTNVTMTAA